MQGPKGDAGDASFGGRTLKRGATTYYVLFYQLMLITRLSCSRLGFKCSYSTLDGRESVDRGLRGFLGVDVL